MLPDPRTGRSERACHTPASSRVVMATTTTTGGTAMLEKVFYTSVLVSDQDEALDFYTNVLGLEKRVENPLPDGPRFLTVGVRGDDFQLVLWPGSPGPGRAGHGASPGVDHDRDRRLPADRRGAEVARRRVRVR